MVQRLRYRQRLSIDSAHWCTFAASNHGSAAHTGCVVAAYAACASRDKANAEAGKLIAFYSEMLAIVFRKLRTSHTESVTLVQFCVFSFWEMLILLLHNEGPCNSKKIIAYVFCHRKQKVITRQKYMKACSSSCFKFVMCSHDKCHADLA